MRYIRYAFLGALAVILIAVALANRESVLLQLLPKEMAALTGLTWSLEVPLFLVIFAAVIAGLLIGFVWEWLREHKHRAEVARKEGEVRQLKREVSKLKTSSQDDDKDDVLALLEKS